VNDLKNQYESRIQPITILNKYLSKEELLNIYNGYKYLPFAKKVERFQQHVDNHYRRIADAKIKEIQEHYDFVVKTFLKDGGLNQSDYLNLVQKMDGGCRLKNKESSTGGYSGYHSLER
jgi:DNA helicase II / ATP-dependent DNA helicase PcrA